MSEWSVSVSKLPPVLDRKGQEKQLRSSVRKERDLQEIESEAYKTVQEIYGEADAKASAIYAEAYDQGPETSEFYGFLKTLESLPEVLNQRYFPDFIDRFSFISVV